jgi:tetratricopeptide (TPR) repeat protein
MEARPDHLVQNARERFDAGDAHGAIHILSELTASGQAFADAYNLLGLSLAMVGRREDALEQFDHALRLNARYVDAHLNRAIVLSDMGRSEEAQAAFAAAQSLGGVDHTGFPAPVASQLANLHADLAEAYVEAGGTKQAIAQLEAAAALRPQFVDLRYRLARLYLEEGRTERARLELEGVVAQRPGFADAWVAMGMARYLGRDVRGARSAWEEAKRLAPGDLRTGPYLSLLSRVEGS